MFAHQNKRAPFYFTAHIEITVRSEQQMFETFAKRTAHQVRSIRDTNVSNVRVSNEQT